MATELEILASGYGLIEGPRADAKGSLYFSDVLLGGVYRRTPEGEIETVVPKRRGVGGISLHAEGGLVISGRNVCHVRDGETRVLFERQDIAGFNDLFADGEGRVLAGSLRADPFGTSGERTPGELWRLDADGRATELYGGGRVARFRPDGAPDGGIEVPASAVTSLCFGGDDLRDAYITTADNADAPELRGCVFRTRVDTPGLPAPLARV